MAGVRTEYLQAKSGKSRSSSNQMPQSALRSGKYDTSNSQLNELKFDLSVIFDIYGYDATLYDVLSIDRNASAREIKAAYLNKGRELLLVGRNSSEPISDVAENSRKEFQAISLAYEILSKEHLRALYDGRCNVARKNSVQWSNVVQEKVIKDAHPNEHSHRRRSRRAPQVSPAPPTVSSPASSPASSPVSPPVYDDGCRELDDEIDELMYYCNDDGGINFVDFDELQGLVHILNTSINEKKMHLFENESQSSEEAATREGEDLTQRGGDEQRQPSSAQSEDDDATKTRNGGTSNSVRDAAEEAIFPVDGNVSEDVGGRELNKSTLAIAAAATAVAAVLVKAEAQSTDPPNAGHFACGEFGVAPYGDDNNDLIESVSNQEAPDTDDPTNETSNCAPEENTNIKSKQVVKLRKVTSRRKSKSLVDINVVEKPSADAVSDEVAAHTTGTSVGWFACCGASYAFANDDDGEIEGDNTGGNDDTAGSTKDNADDAVVDVGSAGAEEKSQNDKIKPSMKLRKAIISRRKLKSRIDTEDQEQPAVDDAAGESTSWFACCGVSEAMANDNDGDEITANNMVEKKEKSLGEGDWARAEEKSTKYKTKPSKLRKAMVSRMKSKSLLETEDQEPSALKSEDQEPSAEAAAGTNAGWFTCCGAPEALADDNDGEMPVSNELVEEKVADEDAGGENEEKAGKNKTKPSMKLRKAMGSRRKTKSLQQHPTTEVVAIATGASASASWFVCCGTSEALANNDDISEMSFDHMSDDMEATSKVLSEEQNIPDKDLGGEAEIKTVGSKSNPSKKLLKTVSIRPKTKNSEKKQLENAKAEEEEEELAMPSFLSCCGASAAEAEVISDKREDTDSAKVEAKTQHRLSNSARKLRNQLTTRKKTIRPLLDMDENDASVKDTDHITAKADAKQGKTLMKSMKKMRKMSFNKL